MISRERARAIAESAALALRIGAGINDVYQASEMTSQLPRIYNGPDLSSCWIAHVKAPIRGLHASIVVLIRHEDGKVLYAGSAYDER